VLDQESREEIDRFLAANVVRQVVEQSEVLLRGLEVEIDIPDRFLLPPGRLSEWTAIIQNVLINAANANARVAHPMALVRAENVRRDHRLVLSDTGTGVDIESSDVLFEPFVRRMPAPGRGVGVGGTGLGLTIVRMIARNLRCATRFIEPDPPFTTAFELRWRNK
jgi:signal transduction histidine kinase